ncbi:MAG: hypothetical protein WC340_04710 [Kiritimatiellia bacterium]
MFNKLKMVTVLSLVYLVASAGVRPYELDWAGRMQDDHPALIDFETLDGWSVESKDATACFSRSQEQKIWGDYVGKIVYQGTGPAPDLLVKPPAPIEVPAEFDAVSLWVYGNNFLSRDPTTPSVAISVCFQDQAGKPFEVSLFKVNWAQWHLCYRRLSEGQITRVQKGKVLFCGFRITGGKNTEERSLFFDSLCLFTESFQPLTFKPRAKRGVQVFANQDQGANTGAGKLPFPNRIETIIPHPVGSALPVIEHQGDRLVMQVPKGLGAEISLRSCQWDELRLRWTESNRWIQPSVGGGLFFVGAEGEAVAPDTVSLSKVKVEQDRAICTWVVNFAGKSAVVKITWWMLGQNLVADIAVEGGVVQELRFGRVAGLEEPRFVALPYYTYGTSQRPALAIIGPADQPLFLAEHIDWTLSNASTLFAVNEIEGQDVTINGGVRYIPKTNGERNACYERFVFSLSPQFESILPEIPNPPSPWKAVTGKGVWRAYGASNRETDAAFWRSMHRYGLHELIVTDHETGWRDEHESFTFRTRTAPKKGGDEGQFKYARIMQDELGYVYGPYNNFTDFAPVNEFWSSDLITRLPNNQLHRAWARCYAPKPLRAVEYCEKLAPAIQKKFQFSTAYCDVHTAVTPWSRTDYDYRVPGAGTFSQTFYAYGEIMLLQKRTWGGPVYSEGNNHFLYCGLADGNYAQDQHYNLSANPWVVDFDLQKMHDLCCNFGVGNVSMFFGKKADLGATPQALRSSLDRFLAATLAFGHPGFLLRRGGIENTLRSYYMLQQIAERYTLASAKRIWYFDGTQLVDTSTAVAGGAHKRSQVAVEYDGGVNVIVNGSITEDLQVHWKGRDIALPPNGYQGWSDDGEIEVFSALQDGHRVDYARTPKYIYLDGRSEFTRFPDAAASGTAICRFEKDGSYEVIPVGNSECGFAINAKSAVALDKDGVTLGPCDLRLSRGLTWIQPVEGAFSYRLQPADALADKQALTCDVLKVVPGQVIAVSSQREKHEIKVAADAVPGERIWKKLNHAWIDFTVVPLCKVEMKLSGNSLIAALTPSITYPRGVVQANSQKHELDLVAGQEQELEIPVPSAPSDDFKGVSISIQAGNLRQQEYGLMFAQSQHRNLLPLPSTWKSGMRLRDGAEEEALSDLVGAKAYLKPGMECGGATKEGTVFVHPPYKGGIGYTFIEYSSLKLPQNLAAFRAFVGKGDGSALGDGIAYSVVVEEINGKETRAGSWHVTKHAWLPIEVDLSAWAGQTINLKLIADARGDTSGDWGGWAEMRLESLQKEQLWTLLPQAEAHFKPSPQPLPDLTEVELKQARRGVIRYQGIGLSGVCSRYGSKALLNTIELGNMAPAAGDSKNNIWSDLVEIPLNAEALQSLRMHNVFEIFNPGEDCFKVCNFCLEVELADGRKAATLINAGITAQPGSWLYAEGVGVPQGRNIKVHLWFLPR